MLRAEGRDPDRWAALAAYVPFVGALYRSIASATGATIVIDSSKRPADAAVTRLVADIEPYAVHLVRDPRAVAHSWSRSKPELDRGIEEEMPRQSPIRSALGWAELNGMSELVRRRFGSRGLLLRYEDLVRDVPGSLRRILDLLGERDTDVPLLDGEGAVVRPNHTVSGNPGRFASGRISVRADDRWVASLPSLDHAMTTAVTLPLLLRYGYPIGRPATMRTEPSARA